MRIVIVGAGEVGSHLAKMLRAEANEVSVIDNDQARLDNLCSIVDVVTIKGMPSSIKTLHQAEVGKADLFIAVFPFVAQDVNILSAILAKRLGAGKVIARVSDEDYLTAENKLMFKELGIELTFYPEKNAADEIVSALKYASMTESMDFARGKLRISVFKLDESSPLLDMRLGDFIVDITPEELEEFRVIAISRENKSFIPSLDTKFMFGDLVFTISRKEGSKAMYRRFGKEDVSAGSVMIMGGTQIARMVASSLSRQGVVVKIIEKDMDRCVELSETLPGDVKVVNGDGRNSDFLYDEGIRDFDAFIALTGHDENNVLSCVVAKKFGVSRTIAEVENIEYIRLAEEMGVDTVINKKLITAGRIFKFTLSGKARFVRYMTDTNAEVIEYTVPPGSAITKGPLKNMSFPSNAIIAGVIRGNESFIATGSTVIEEYDRVTIFAMPESIKEVDRFFK